MKMKRILAILLVLTLCVSMLAACGQSGKTDTPSDSQTETDAPADAEGGESEAEAEADAGEAETEGEAEAEADAGAVIPVEDETTLKTVAIMTSEHFTPLVNGNGDKHVFHALFDCLFMFDNDGNPVPMLAESFTQDGLDVTIKMREDATFADGTPVKASDVVFSYNTTLEDPTLMYNMTMFFTACEAVSDYEVKFTLANSYCKWQNLLAELLYIVEEATYDKSNDYTDTAPGGSGAYVLDHQDSAGTVYLTARDDYWRCTPDFKNVEVYANMDDATELISLQTGELDLAPQIGLATYTQAKNVDGLTAIAFDGWSTMGLMTFVGDNEFRQAIFHGIDRQTILDICNEGNGSPSTNFFAPKVVGVYTDAVPFTGYDPELAKECLAKSTADLSATYTISVFDDDSAAVAQCIQQDMAALGINMQVEQIDTNTWFDRLMAGTLEFGLTAMATDMVGLEDMISMFDPDAGYPFPLSDKLLEMVKTAPYIPDDNERYDAMIELINQLLVECQWTPLYDTPMYMAYNSRVTNINDCGAGTCVFYFADMKLA